jgi:hypothetical protein
MSTIESRTAWAVDLFKKAERARVKAERAENELHVYLLTQDVDVDLYAMQTGG